MSKKKPVRTSLDTFALGCSKVTIHVLVAEVDDAGVSQRAWCGAPLEPNSIPWSAEITAEQIKHRDKHLCKRCAKGNTKAKLLIDEEIHRLG